MKKKRYTLIELIVTITIIGILATVLMSAMKIAQDQVKEVDCRGNMKNLGESIFMYNSDHQNEMPEGGPGSGISESRYFVFDIAPYLGFEDKVYPNATSNQTLWYKYTSFSRTTQYELPDVLKCGFRQDDGYISYGWNHWYIRGSIATNDKKTEWKRIKYGRVRSYKGNPDYAVTNLSDQMVLGDSSNSVTHDAIKAGRYTSSSFNQLSTRHVGEGGEVGGNYLFMDGHTEWKPKSYMMSPDSVLSFWSVYK